MSEPWRVLVADDDVETCALIKTILRRSHYAVSTCHDAESALVQLKGEAPFDLIICDFMLPGISGVELIAHIRAEPSSARVPIVMISARTNYKLDARAKSAGANAFLGKPFTLSQLRTTVEALLRARLSAASAT